MQNSTVNQDDRSLGDLGSELARQMSTLVRQEVNLARTEMTQKAKTVARDVALMVIGGVVALGAYLALLAMCVLGLVQIGVPYWLSALIVAVVFGAVAYFLFQLGMSGLKRTNMAPQQTIETLKEDVTWAREQAH
ncbi:MAG TPA: phage holin family protein [Ktedonobacterales bacterium]|nr:phage holin family protein [Ktedonobacterales bacterium]